MNTTCAIAWACVLLLLPLHFLCWLCETPEQRCRRLRGYGWSQRAIAEHLGCSRYHVRKALTA